MKGPWKILWRVLGRVPGSEDSVATEALGKLRSEGLGGPAPLSGLRQMPLGQRAWVGKVTLVGGWWPDFVAQKGQVTQV